MSLLPSSIPRATELQQLQEDPLAFLARARSSVGDIVVIRDAGPIFSRSADCNGAVAVFGPRYNRAVLSNIDLFGMPVSAAQRLSLPQHLVNLNFGLHSMRGEQHAQHQRLLVQVLNERGIEDQHGSVGAGLEAFAQAWHVGDKIALLGAMRQLALQVSSRLLFGARYAGSGELAFLLQAYFQLRREAASPFDTASQTSREELLALGTALDDALRRHIRWCRQHLANSSDGILARLARLELAPGRPLSEDELVAHGNVLFVSSNEPIAVALTWTLLILSQLPGVRRALRDELDQVSFSGCVPPMGQLGRLTLLDSVVNETLRLLPPNALMVRVTTRQAALGDLLLPERCELVLCPFVAHRDPERFPRPSAFLPSRWSWSRPSPFEYFPFGGGGHYCVGRYLATYLIKAALSFLMQRYELVLADDQQIDWRVHIIFMPSNEPIITVQASRTSSLQKAGKLLGAVGELVSLDACEL